MDLRVPCLVLFLPLEEIRSDSDLDLAREPLGLGHSLVSVESSRLGSVLSCPPGLDPEPAQSLNLGQPWSGVQPPRLLEPPRMHLFFLESMVPSGHR
jgi:hypothetical protein